MNQDQNALEILQPPKQCRIICRIDLQSDQINENDLKNEKSSKIIIIDIKSNLR